MVNGFNIFGERGRISPRLAEEVKARWGVIYNAAESVRSSVIVEYGTDIVRPVTPVVETVAKPAGMNAAPANAAQVGSNVVNMEAYREHKAQIHAEAEGLGQERYAQQARMNIEQALLEGDNGQLAA